MLPKYDKESLEVLRKTGAKAVVLIVFDGRDGNGMAVQEINKDTVAPQLPQILRQVADVIESDSSKAIKSFRQDKNMN